MSFADIHHIFVVQPTALYLHCCTHSHSVSDFAKVVIRVVAPFSFQCDRGIFTHPPFLDCTTLCNVCVLRTFFKPRLFFTCRPTPSLSNGSRVRFKITVPPCRNPSLPLHISTYSSHSPCLDLPSTLSSMYGKHPFLVCVCTRRPTSLALERLAGAGAGAV